MTSTASSYLVHMLNPINIIRLPTTCSNKQSVVFAWGPLQTFRGAIKTFLKDGAGGYTQAENNINPNANLVYPTHLVTYHT